MSQISDLQTDERAALERVALFARNQLMQAVDELLARFVGADFLQATRDSNVTPSRERFDLEHARFRNLAEILLQWHSSDELLSEDGSPKLLPKTGKVSLTTLVKRVVGSQTSASALVRDLVRLGFVEEIDGAYRPTRRSAVLQTANALNLAYATITTTRLLNTITHNVTRGTPRLYERQVSEVAIRTVDLPLYLRFVEQQAQLLIESTDDWLSRRRASPTAHADVIKVCIGAFAWADLSPPSPVKRSQRVRRKRR